MKLQISFDLLDLEKALKIAHEVEPYCDQFEIGTPMLYRFGIQAIEAFRADFGRKTLVADTKIIDRGEQITTLVAQAGADWLTVMGGTNRRVLYAVVQAAKAQKINVMIDMIDIGAPGQMAMDAQGLHAQALLMHKPHDEGESLSFLDEWDLVRGNTPLPIFVAASITRANIDAILKLKPNGVVIGSAITGAENPAQEAQYFYQLCNNN